MIFRSRMLTAVLLLGLAGAVLPLPVRAFGPEGHLIAGLAAEPLLCPAAAAEVAALGDGRSLGEIGLWADRVRGQTAYADSAPWHYMNIEDGASIARFRHPPEGDVLWAIERDIARLGDFDLAREQRAEALRFLVHFVVDIHQPLHVGRASDRGGNTIALRFRGEDSNLHRFWDTHAIELADLSVRRYAANLAPLITPDEVRRAPDPRRWAQESLDLRERVYGFDASAAEMSNSYQRFAAETTRDRLALAAARLAATLNAVFCP